MSTVGPTRVDIPTWGPDRNGTREMVGIDRAVLRAFSKRTLAIEAELDAQGAVYESPAARMRADDAASLATRPPKDHSLTPTLLAERWQGEARALGIDSAAALEAALTGHPEPAPLSPEEVTAALLDPETGLCASSARFTEAHVVEHVAALSAGRWTTTEIASLASDFVASEHVVRLVPADQGRRRPPEDEGRHGESVDAGLLAIASEPLRESAQAALIRAYLGEGNRVDALRQYQRYQVLLHEELGVEPGPRLKSLVHGG